MAILIFISAAIAEIAGCFSFWAWLNLKKSSLWLMPGFLALCVFAGLLTLIESDYAGRVYAAYGAIYICASIAWMWLIEKHIPDRFDLIGALICLIGALVIMAHRPN